MTAERKGRRHDGYRKEKPEGGMYRTSVHLSNRNLQAVDLGGRVNLSKLLDELLGEWCKKKGFFDAVEEPK